MTPEEREQLRRDLGAAGCPALANAVNEWPHLMTAELPELRSLLRREVDRRSIADLVSSVHGMQQLGFLLHARSCGMKNFLPGAVTNRAWDMPECPYSKPILREAWYQGWLYNAAIYLFMESRNEVPDVPL